MHYSLRIAGILTLLWCSAIGLMLGGVPRIIAPTAVSYLRTPNNELAVFTLFDWRTHIEVTPFDMSLLTLNYSWHPNGLAIYPNHYGSGQATVWQVGLHGQAIQPLLQLPISVPLIYALSPDGTQLAYTYNITTAQDLMLLDIPSQTTRRLYDNLHILSDLMWANESLIFIYATPERGADIGRINTITGTFTPLVETPNMIEQKLALSADGQSLWYIAGDGRRNIIYPLNLQTGEAEEASIPLPYSLAYTMTWASDSHTLIFSLGTFDTGWSLHAYNTRQKTWQRLTDAGGFIYSLQMLPNRYD